VFRPKQVTAMRESEIALKIEFFVAKLLRRAPIIFGCSIADDLAECGSSARVDPTGKEFVHRIAELLWWGILAKGSQGLGIRIGLGLCLYDTGDEKSREQTQRFPLYKGRVCATNRFDPRQARDLRQIAQGIEAGNQRGIPTGIDRGGPSKIPGTDDVAADSCFEAPVAQANGVLQQFTKTRACSGWQW